jgi:hypothetical protein
MAASAGTLVLHNPKTNRVFTVDLYLPDATATKLGFNGAGLAGTASPTTYRVPEDCNIVDLSIAAAPTAVGAALVVNSGVVNGGAIRWANQLATLANRLKQKVPLRAGDFIEYTQF